MSVLDRLISDGQQCRIWTKDIAYHAWPANAKRGSLCQCGELRVKRKRRNGELESEKVKIE